MRCFTLCRFTPALSTPSSGSSELAAWCFFERVRRRLARRAGSGFGRSHEHASSAIEHVFPGTLVQASVHCRRAISSTGSAARQFSWQAAVISQALRGSGSTAFFAGISIMIGALTGLGQRALTQVPSTPTTARTRMTAPFARALRDLLNTEEILPPSAGREMSTPPESPPLGRQDHYGKIAPYEDLCALQRTHRRTDLCSSAPMCCVACVATGVSSTTAAALA